MKVVLFCGGLGSRLRAHSETIPKPLVTIGDDPIIWHLMRYYHHYGHHEFILCLGYGGDQIRRFFESTGEPEAQHLVVRHAHLNGCKVHLVDTGIDACVGERLRRVREWVQDESVFLANYSDGLSDLPLDHHIRAFAETDAIAGFASVHISQSYHLVESNGAGTVTRLPPAQAADVWINGGFMVLRNTIFDYLEPNEELVEAPFQRLINRQKLYTYRYSGFFAAMDTFKDYTLLNRRHAAGDTPWMVWE